MKKPFLYTPGPTPVPERVLAAMARPIINHRSQDFKDVFQKVRNQLKEVFQTENPVLTLTTSGTGAMEASMTSTLKKNDRVLVVNAGKFGERFEKMAKAFGLQTDVLRVEWGKAASIERLRTLLTPEHAALCVQATETSTGTTHPIEQISQLLRRQAPETLLVVDGITAVGAMDIPMDRWGIDILISGSQKAFMMPPGLAFVAVSKRAEERMKGADLPCFYFDLRRELKNLNENQTAFTPAISLIAGLYESLSMILEEGLTQVIARHTRVAKSSRDALQALGLKLASEAPSVACTTAFLPAGLDGKALLKSLRTTYGFTVAGGQDQWEGKVVRLSHLGYYTPFDIMNAIAAIGRQLNRMGVACPTAKALEVFMDSYDL